MGKHVVVGRKSSNQSRRRRVILLTLAAAGALPLPARATFTHWSGNDGNWTPGSWDNGVPGAGYDASITNTDSTNRTITYNYTGSAITLNSLSLYNTGAGSDTLSQSANTLTVITENL